jgi:hypothetical protein
MHPITDNSLPVQLLEEFLKSFPIGFLIRSFMAGLFLPLSISLSDGGPKAVYDAITTGKADAKLFSGTSLAVAVIAGFTIYVLHRSIVYPIIEGIMDSRCTRRCRRRCRLIGASTLLRFKRNWGRFDSDPSSERTRQLSTWADLTHFQYASAHCVILGIAVAKGFTDLKSPVVLLAVPFYLGAFWSDWRLRTAQDFFDRILQRTRNRAQVRAVSNQTEGKVQPPKSESI